MDILIPPTIYRNFNHQEYQTLRRVLTKQKERRNKTLTLLFLSLCSRGCNGALALRRLLVRFPRGILFCHSTRNAASGGRSVLTLGRLPFYIQDRASEINKALLFLRINMSL